MTNGCKGETLAEDCKEITDMRSKFRNRPNDMARVAIVSGPKSSVVSGKFTVALPVGCTNRFGSRSQGNGLLAESAQWQSDTIYRKQIYRIQIH